MTVSKEDHTRAHSGEILSHGHSRSQKIAECSDSPKVAELRGELERFELGRFLLANLGLNGYWTSYVLLHPDKGRLSQVGSDGKPLTRLESWLLDRCPIFLATQERFRTFRRLTQPLVRSNMRLASIPSGLMDDLLTLDYSRVQDVTLTAIDLDPVSIEYARANYGRSGQRVAIECEQRDAWSLDSPSRWDVVTSNGLNIYIEEDLRCVDFYRSVADSLRPNGYFILSFITPPDTWRPYEATDLEMQRYLFREVLPVKWQCLRSEDTTREQLAAAGLDVINIEYDTQRMFPALVAQKRER
jgi:SAM-dependent methyltransferase